MYPGLVSCPFYAIPIYPFKFMKFFIYLYYKYYIGFTDIFSISLLFDMFFTLVLVEVKLNGI